MNTTMILSEEKKQTGQRREKGKERGKCDCSHLNEWNMDDLNISSKPVMDHC